MARESVVRDNASQTDPRLKESEVNLRCGDSQQSSCSSTVFKVTNPCHSDGGERDADTSVAFSRRYDTGRSTMPPPSPVEGQESPVKQGIFTPPTVIAIVGIDRQLLQTERPLPMLTASACSPGVEGTDQRIATEFNSRSMV